LTSVPRKSVFYYGWANLAIAALAMVGTLPGRTQGLGLITEPLLADLHIDRVTYATVNLWATLIGADWNTECADRIESFGGWELYEPADPYASVEWFADLIYQCRWEYDERGRRRHWADRRPGDVLWAGGLHDAAALLRAEWHPTAGHHPDDVYGAHGVRRRIDGVRVTRSLVTAMRAHHVLDTALTREASDHLPVTVEYLPAEILTL